ncbi:hypothetical protein SB6411_03191 [Klebsiella spallanzanii]|uniref:Uncharacterized protein n=1 Tax=Klebsiella spallanzanii TaxID=2587528 RepID=A0ABY6VHR2_9ENTR|nr:hypothetical protein SB6411_03191 [Klebsiella spallanzanii]
MENTLNKKLILLALTFSGRTVRKEFVFNKNTPLFLFFDITFILLTLRDYRYRNQILLKP